MVDEALNEKDDHSSRPTFRLCVHDRDFTPGRMITENIVSNIFKSRHVSFQVSRIKPVTGFCATEFKAKWIVSLDDDLA